VPASALPQASQEATVALLTTKPLSPVFDGRKTWKLQSELSNQQMLAQSGSIFSKATVHCICDQYTVAGYVFRAGKAKDSLGLLLLFPEQFFTQVVHPSGSISTNASVYSAVA
jgi:hypothetical protein